MKSFKILFLLSAFSLAALALTFTERAQALVAQDSQNRLFKTIRNIEELNGRLGLKRCSDVQESGSVQFMCWAGDKESESVCVETKEEHEFLNAGEAKRHEKEATFGFGDIVCKTI